MKRRFIHTPEFDRKWKELIDSDDVLLKLQVMICENSECGDVVPGTHALRKVRLALPGHGKSSSLRVMYVDFAMRSITFLVTLFSKNQKANLTKGERNELGDFVLKLRAQLDLMKEDERKGKRHGRKS